ncbi:MAG: type IV pilus modification protein PilV [Burkholderiaceae bacterium]|nr:type IV pilus modification protein PilV [Burkholderiaceae bacterium]GIL03692.1 MAG: type IV pilus modification protein PilV [Betaproteobacteria bacterium]
MTSSVPRVRRQRGLSLLEVLVAIVILSLGLLGMAGLQAASLRTSQGSFYRAQAAQYADDMAERMRANLGQARNYGLALADAAPTGTSVRDRDLADWLAKLRNLPAGDGAVAIDLANNLVTITVQWDDTRAGGPANANYTVVTRLWNN